MRHLIFQIYKDNSLSYFYNFKQCLSNNVYQTIFEKPNTLTIIHNHQFITMQMSWKNQRKVSSNVFKNIQNFNHLSNDIFSIFATFNNYTSFVFHLSLFMHTFQKNKHTHIYLYIFSKRILCQQIPHCKTFTPWNHITHVPIIIQTQPLFFLHYSSKTH